MKTCVYLSLLLFWGNSLALYSQRLSHREIFNFNQGDIIHTAFQAQAAPVYVKRTFVSKTVSLQNDSFYYTVHDSIYQLNSAQIWKLSLETKQLVYTDLDSYPAPTLDTSYIDPCNNIVNYTYYTDPDSIIFEGHHYFLTAYEGLGTYLHYRNDFSSGGDETRHWLIYYCKAGNCCGERIKNLSLQPGTQVKTLNLYPNPFSHFISLYAKAGGVLLIYNAEGKLIQETEMTGNELTIETQNLAPGVYSFVLQTEEGNYYKKLLKF